MTQPIEPTVKSMKRSITPFLFGLAVIIIFGVLAGSVITLINSQQQLKARVSGLQQELAKQPAPTANKPASPAGGQPSTTSSQSAPSSPSSPSSLSSPSWSMSPSQPSQSHKVEKGETLFVIGQKYSIEWASIVKANGLADENLIKVGDVLVVPTVDAKAGVNQVDFTVDTEKAKAIQATTNTQPSTANWRLDPVEVAKKEGSGVYGLTANDNWVLGNKNSETGQATVRVVHEDKQYEVSLTQPVEKGESGIWAVTVVKPVVK